MVQNRLLILGIILTLLAIPLTVLALNGNLDFRKKAAVSAVSFSFSPSSGTIANGNDFEINILLDSAGHDVSGADLALTYDSDLVEVVDADDTKSGIQIKSGDIFSNPLVLANKAEENKIFLSINSARPFNGVGIFGTLKLHAKKIGKLTLTIESQDSRVVEKKTAQNILTAYKNGSFIIEGVKNQPNQATASATPQVDKTIDFNQDGLVDELDLQIFSKKIGATTDITQVDFNKDGKVNNADLQIFLGRLKALKAKS